jgi:hypothetical protein
MELAKTLRYRREEITTPFIRDADDTVPVELYSRPYERIDIQLDSSPSEQIEIAPSRSFRLVLAITVLCGAFALGIGFAFVAL